MRIRISERNEFPKFDLYNEYRKIDLLLSETKIAGTYNKLGEFINDYFTLEEFMEYVGFNDWNLRGTFISVEEMREGLGIRKGSITPSNITEEKVLDFLQYAMNCVYRIAELTKNAKKSPFSDDTLVTMLWDNIEKFIDKLNCMPKYDEEKQEIYILYKNSIAEVIYKENIDIEESIKEYIQIDNKGDLKRKAEILCTLYKKLEQYSSVFKGSTYKSLYEDTKFLFNKSGVRHSVEDDPISSVTFMNMNEIELEEWYDKIYNMFLSCMVIVRYLENKSSINEIKRVIDNRE